MKNLGSILLLFLCPALLAQRNIEKKVNVSAGQSIFIDVDYPELIKVYTSPTNELIVKVKVSINRGENDDAFVLTESLSDKTVTIKSEIKNLKNLPKRILIKRGDQEYYFKTENYKSAEVQKFIEDNGGEYEFMNSGVIKEIEMEVYVPKGVAVKVEAKFGLVEVFSCESPLTVISKFGGVDATIPVKGIGDITARTHYGEILTNLSEKPEGNPYARAADHWTVVNFKFGAGNHYDFESKFGKVYLRKAQ